MKTLKGNEMLNSTYAYTKRAGYYVQVHIFNPK